MRWWLVVIAVLVIAGIIMFTPFDLRAMTGGRTGNTPDTPDDEKRLRWLQGRRDELLALLRQRWPSVRMTSAYRNEAVNAAVGGVPTSRHRHGLALDFAAEPKVHATYEAMAEHIRRSVLFVCPRTVIAESTPAHLHVDYFDPLGKLENKTQPTRYLTERSAGSFAPLAEVA